MQRQDGPPEYTYIQAAAPHPGSGSTAPYSITGSIYSHEVPNPPAESTEPENELDREYEIKEQDRWLPIANGKYHQILCIIAPPPSTFTPLKDLILTPFSPVARVMKNALPPESKLSKESKMCMQECVSEFISFVTSGAVDRCQAEKRKTLNGEDVLYAMYSLGFENYAEALKIYLTKYREAERLDADARREKDKRKRLLRKERKERERKEKERLLAEQEGGQEAQVMSILDTGSAGEEEFEYDSEDTKHQRVHDTISKLHNQELVDYGLEVEGDEDISEFVINPESPNPEYAEEQLDF